MTFTGDFFLIRNPKIPISYGTLLSFRLTIMDRTILDGIMKAATASKAV
jgi:hypothetical protein